MWREKGAILLHTSLPMTEYIMLFILMVSALLLNNKEQID